MTTETFAHLPLEHIVTSPTNPRKTFNAEKLTELANSIEASGVHQPVLVRPLPGDRVADTAHLEPRPQWELVSGERRLRASLIAGLDTIPAMVRALTDSQVLEIQLVENLQRDDLEPLEEAEGYDHLMHAHEPPLTAEEVAAKIGKSRSYVYGRLKLLNLGPEGREALREGRLDASRALLIARIPDTKLQAAALGNLFNWQDEPLSYREAASLIQRQYMLRLGEARFKITDATLVPAAGSCRACPKRTGADPDLFADVQGADVCTDPPCFKAKEAAHADRQLATAQAAGCTIIAGREAKALMPSAWDTRVEGHLRLDEPADSPTEKPLRAIIGKQMEAQGIQPTLVANPHKNGELVAVLPCETVSQLLAAKGYQEHSEAVQAQAQKSAQAEAKAIKEKRSTEFEAAWRWLLMQAVWAEINQEGPFELPAEIIRHLAAQKAGALNQDKAKALCKLLDLGKVAPVQAVSDWVANHTEPQKCLALLTMHQDVEYQPWLPATSQPNAALLLLADAEKIAVDAAKATAKAELAAKWKAQDNAAKARAEARAETTPAATPSPRVAPSGGAGGKAKTPAARKPKTTAREAQQAIAAAMQSQAEQTEPDGASAVGEDGRATSPDAGATEPIPGEPDELVSEARRIVVESQKASISYVQRSLRIGYNRAASLLEALELEGVVGPMKASGVREVLQASTASSPPGLASEVAWPFPGLVP